MSTFHGQTRPDAPRIPQDLATKGYVDSAVVSMIGYFTNVNFTTNGIGYWALFNGTNRVGFAVAQTPIGLGTGSAINFHTNVRTNTKDENTIVSIRMASANTEVGVTVPAAATGLFAVNGLTITFDEDSQTAGRIDTILSTVGSFSITTGHATVVVNTIGT